MKRGGKKGGRAGASAEQPGKSEEGLCHLLGNQNWKGAVGRDRGRLTVIKALRVCLLAGTHL